MVPAEEEACAIEGSGQAASRRSLKLLVVDDDATNRLLLSTLLEKEGYQVVSTDDGLKAVDLFRRERPDLVLMDVMMPVMNGYEATRLIKAESGEQFVPIIFLTALSDEQALARCVECGGDDFLTKPYNRVILKAKVDAAMRVRGLHAALLAQKRELGRNRDRLQHEQEIAEGVFANILKPSALEATNLRVLLSPMNTVNGDLVLAAPRPWVGYHYLLGDFTGHGLSAAVGAIPVTDIFLAMTRKGFRIGDIAGEINRKLKAVLPPDLFLAAVLVELDPERGVASVWNGGLPDVLVVGEDGIRQRIASDHLPLGVIGGEGFDGSVTEIMMDASERLYVYSDGVIDAESPDGSRFGEERLWQTLEDGGTATRFDSVRRALAEFRGHATQRDDITLIEIDPRPVAAADGAGDSPALFGSAPRTHWRFALDLDADAVRRVDPIPILTGNVVELEQLESHRERLYMVFAELYNNAVEHGLLRLDGTGKSTPEGFAAFYAERELALEALAEGRVHIEIEHRPLKDGGELVIRMEDTGPGFDSAVRPPELSENLSLRGRGIRVLESICERLTYVGRGNRVEAVYRWG